MFVEIQSQNCRHGIVTASRVATPKFNRAGLFFYLFLFSSLSFLLFCLFQGCHTRIPTGWRLDGKPMLYRGNRYVECCLHFCRFFFWFVLFGAPIGFFIFHFSFFGFVCLIVLVLLCRNGSWSTTLSSWIPNQCGVSVAWNLPYLWPTQCAILAAVTNLSTV